MGALNAAMSKVGNASVSLTYVTGALVKFGQGVCNWLTGRRADLSWLLQVPMWASLLAGSCAAASLQQLGSERPWPLPVVGLLLAIRAMRTGLIVPIPRGNSSFSHLIRLLNREQSLPIS